MRYVYPRYDVAHLWAHQLQTTARDSSGVFYFDGNTIFSYGSHFPMGKVVTAPDGSQVYATNSDTYSNTTAKHMNIMYSAIPNHAKVFRSINATTPEMRGKLKYFYNFAMRVVAGYVYRIQGFMEKQKRARTCDYRNMMARECNELFSFIKVWELDKPATWYQYRTSKRFPAINEFMAKKVTDYTQLADWFSVNKNKVDGICLLFGLLWKHLWEPWGQHGGRVDSDFGYLAFNEIMQEFYNDDTIKDIQARSERIAKAEKTRAKRLFKEAIKKDEAQLEKWHNVEENPHVSFHPSEAFFKAHGWHTALRIDRKGENIQTSKGITISFEEGKRLWVLIKAFESGKKFQHNIAVDINGSKWAFNRYEKHVLFAGCHAIPFSECQAIAKQKGW